MLGPAGLIRSDVYMMSLFLRCIPSATLLRHTRKIPRVQQLSVPLILSSPLVQISRVRPFPLLRFTKSRQIAEPVCFTDIF